MQQELQECHCSHFLNQQVTQEGPTLSTMNKADNFPLHSKGSSQRLQPHLHFKQREAASLSRALRQLFPDRNAPLDQELLPLEQKGWIWGGQSGFTLAVLCSTGIHRDCVGGAFLAVTRCSAKALT